MKPWYTALPTRAIQFLILSAALSSLLPNLRAGTISADPTFGLGASVFDSAWLQVTGISPSIANYEYLPSYIFSGSMNQASMHALLQSLFGPPSLPNNPLQVLTEDLVSFGIVPSTLSNVSLMHYDLPAATQIQSSVVSTGTTGASTSSSRNVVTPSTPVAVPEPGTLVLLGCGIVAFSVVLANRTAPDLEKNNGTAANRWPNM